MTWHTEHLRPSEASVHDTHPYLSALLSTAAQDAPLARGRLRNWLAARQAELSRPDTVPAMPYHVVLDPSTLCNLRCPLCVQATDPAGRPRGFLDMAAYRRLLDELSPYAIRLDLFNWGEPLLHQDFAEVVRLASARSIWTRTSSNLSHPGGISAERLVEAGLGHLVVSADGATQEVYQTYRVRGRLDAVLRNTAELVAARDRLGARWPVVEWQFLVFDHNEDQVDDARRLATEAGADVFRYGGARGRMATKLRRPSGDTFADASDLLLRPDHPLSEYDGTGAKRRSHEQDGCRWLWGKAALNPDGGVAPCVSSWFRADDLGSWYEGLAGVWNAPSFQRARRLARTGGDPVGASLCAQCAHHRNFVPTPDTDTEPVLRGAALAELTDALRASGRPVEPAVLAALTDELAGTRSEGSVTGGG